MGMKHLYEQLLNYLKSQDKERAFKFCMELLAKGEVNVVDLYEEMLCKALNNVIHEYTVGTEELIWREHVRSGIVRTIIEAAYPYVLEERDKRGSIPLGNVMVMCPEFEDHELGARMVADFFTIAGYNTTFIGANTPQSTVIKAVEIIQPKYMCISVTNHYNLVATKKTIQNIKNKAKNSITFLLGGNAFGTDTDMHQQVGGDQLLRTFNDVVNLSKDVSKG